MTYRWVAGFTVAAALASGVAGCGDEPPEAISSRASCAQLRDRMLDLRMESVTADRAQHRAALGAALDDGSATGFVERCLAQMSAEQVQCGLAARDSSALGACQTR